MNGERAHHLRQRVDALSEAQRVALADMLAREAGMHAPERLVAFVVAGTAGAPPDAALRAYLGAQLPDYMVPARVVAIDRLPRTAAGKLDRRALERERLPLVSAPSPPAPPLTALTNLESKLAAIWRDVLKVEDVGLDDDFFEIGGDSLLSIRVIARAGREGVRISPERFFERPTIRHMAQGVTVPSTAGRPAAGEEHVDAGDQAFDVAGDAPLTPIQHWFLDAIGDRDWWNQSYLLDVGHALSARQLRDIVGHLVRQHDALRLRLVQRDGEWRQHFAAPDEEVPFRVVRLDGIGRERYHATVIEEGEREHASLRLAQGRLFRGVYFEGSGGWRRLLLLGHHVVLDGVSWSVILEDLATLVTLASRSEALQLPAPSAPARAWAHALAARAATADTAAALPHWQSMPTGEVRWPDDAGAVVRRGGPGQPAGTNRDAVVLTLRLEADAAHALLHVAPRRLEVSVLSLLLAALLASWRRWSGAGDLRLDLEGHGRDLPGNSLDVSRTVGWFTTVFPVHLDFPHAFHDDAGPVTAEVVRTVQRTLDALPMRGAAHGLLRHLAPDETARSVLASPPRPVLLFNHLGTHDLTLPAASRLRVTNEAHGRARGPDVARPYPLELNSRVEDGSLIVAIEYPRGMLEARSMERFAASFRHALDEVAAAQPARFGLAGLDRSALQAVAGLLDELDDA